MKKELRKFGIRWAKEPQKHNLLSGVVRVCDEGRRVTYIKFHESFVDAVGLALPYGLSPDNPAYIKVMRVGSTWRVYAMYVLEEIGALLWEADAAPQWVNRSKRSNHESGETSSARGA